MPVLVPTADGAILAVKVQPRASATALAGTDPEWLRIRLQAPPVDGKANKALLVYLAKTLGVPKRSLTLMSGETSRLKRVGIAGVPLATIRTKLGLG